MQGAVFGYLECPSRFGTEGGIHALRSSRFLRIRQRPRVSQDEQFEIVRLKYMVKGYTAAMPWKLFEKLFGDFAPMYAMDNRANFTH